MNTNAEPGWECVAMHDPSGRRGIWMRVTPGTVEICAGREGNDDYVRITRGQVVDDAMLIGLCGIMDTATWVREDIANLPPWTPDYVPDAELRAVTEETKTMVLRNEKEKP